MVHPLRDGMIPSALRSRPSSNLTSDFHAGSLWVLGPSKNIATVGCPVLQELHLRCGRPQMRECNFLDLPIGPRARTKEPLAPKSVERWRRGLGWLIARKGGIEATGLQSLLSLS